MATPFGHPGESVRCGATIVILLLNFLAGCQSPEYLGRLDGAIELKQIRTHLKFLSDDLLRGRAPGSTGGAVAARYIAAQFEAAGLRPAVGDSSFFQDVELFGIRSSATISVRGYGRNWRLSDGPDFVGWNAVTQPLAAVRSREVLFMGYGIDAPEYGWSDYDGVDVTGRILLMLANEPPSQSQVFFEGKTLTYYGRWTYKFEEAARRGAEGVILIHTPELAGYGWNVVQGSFRGETFSIGKRASVPRLSLRAWVSETQAKEWLAAAGLSLTDLISRAGSSSFKAEVLNLRVSATVRNEIRTLHAPNVIGKLDGSDPGLKKECIIYTSHYDHLGMTTAAGGDSIYNGAVDNASGTAALLEIARALVENAKPRRTVLFAAVTAEEWGALGSRYYTEHPVIPLARTSANINFDMVNVYGPTRDMIAIGAERSGMAPVLRRVAREMHVRLMPDPAPAEGANFCSDHFSFAEKGVPAVYLLGGLRFLAGPEGQGTTLRNEYKRASYHSVDDEYDPSWSLEGAAQVSQFALKTGLYLANSSSMVARGVPADSGRSQNTISN